MSVSATTISFTFVGPTDTGGIKIKAYAVQYKEISQTWEEARNKSWPVGKYCNTKFIALRLRYRTVSGRGDKLPLS